MKVETKRIIRTLTISITNFCSSFSRSLLILDDVWSSDVVKTFNVSGRVLITTQDVSVVDVIPQSQRIVVEVRKGLCVTQYWDS